MADAPSPRPPLEPVAGPADIAVALSGGGNRATRFARDRAFPYAEVSQFKHRYPDDADLPRMKGDQRMESWSELRLLETLGHESLAWHCSALPTTLGRIGRADPLRLLMHGYQNALGEYFAQGDPRPRPSPDRSRFTRLIAPRGRETDDLSVDGKIVF